MTQIICHGDSRLRLPERCDPAGARETPELLLVNDPDQKTSKEKWRYTPAGVLTLGAAAAADYGGWHWLPTGPEVEALPQPGRRFAWPFP
ncbi:MAG: hypothetical protein ACR2NN_09765 [Bryobacteraceae bacterium]